MRDFGHVDFAYRLRGDARDRPVVLRDEVDRLNNDRRVIVAASVGNVAIQLNALAGDQGVRVANASPDRPQPRLAGQDVHTLRRWKVLRRQPSTDYGWVHSAVYAHDPLIFWTTTYFFWTALCVSGFLG